MLAMIFAMAASSASGRAQLEISGRVTSVEGNALVGVVVFLDRMAIATLSKHDGSYLLTVPDSIAHGQRASLTLRLLGHAKAAIPVILSGTRIVRDTVLAVDTSQDCCVRIGASDAVTPKSDLRVSGTVTDSAGNGLSSVQIVIAGMSLGTITDPEGKYALRISAERVDGRVATIQAHQLGYLPTEDTVSLCGSEARRTFVMLRPINNGSAAEALASDTGIARAARLRELWEKPHREGERELRVRVYGGLFLPWVMYRFVDRSGKVDGELIAYWPSRDQEDENSSRKAAAAYPGKACKWTSYGAATCRMKLQRKPDWRGLWRSLDSLDVWSISDQGPLHKRIVYVLDGQSIVGETWDGHAYNAWAYEPGAEDVGPDARKVGFIESMMRDLNSYTWP
jgi:hypothetical protein